MRAIVLFELILVILFTWGFSTQIVIPFVDGEKFFPFFRNRRKLESDLRAVRTEIADKNLNEQVETLRKEIE